MSASSACTAIFGVRSVTDTDIFCAQQRFARYVIHCIVRMRRISLRYIVANIAAHNILLCATIFSYGMSSTTFCALRQFPMRNFRNFRNFVSPQYPRQSYRKEQYFARYVVLCYVCCPLHFAHAAISTAELRSSALSATIS